MRQRNIKNLRERVAANSTYLIEEPKSLRGKWREAFGNDRPIFLEIGCGKGKFILSRAKANPDINYIAVEGQENVALRALEKAEAEGLSNLRIFVEYIKDIGEYFETGEIDGIYLNFSDPWPKARHEKRRLTCRKNLESFFDIAKVGSFIELKTDNDGLFEYSENEISEMGYTVGERTDDLHSEACTYESKRFTTEYEEKFSGRGKNIHYIKFRRG